MRLITLSITFLLFFCQKPEKQIDIPVKQDKGDDDEIIVGAARFGEYLDILEEKNVALAVNPTSMVGQTHLVDTLRSLGIDIVKVFAPEHGFRGTADAGELVKNSIDTKTGIPIVSLHGKQRKPSSEQLSDVDVLIFDIQDVGVRFYTYISTMHNLMEAAAENNKKILVLDRPNPNGMYIDGPVLDTAYQSFLGMHPIPIVHGLTVGELAEMINGEGWLKGDLQSDLHVIPMANYDHSKRYSLPVKPSPNLPNDLSIALYPSLGLFEGTHISVGRGTYEPFLQIGHPDLDEQYSYYFVPESIEGMSKYPPFEGEEVYGLDLRDQKIDYNFTLDYLLDMFQALPDKTKFFRKGDGFELHAGVSELREQIEAGISKEDIRATWQPELDQYRITREKYLLYPDSKQ